MKAELYGLAILCYFAIAVCMIFCACTGLLSKAGFVVMLGMLGFLFYIVREYHNS